MVVAVVSLAAIPLGVLFSTMWDRSQPRRSRFWLRFAGLLLCTILPWIVAVLAAVGEQSAGSLLWIGFVSGLLVVSLAPLVLFHRRGEDPGRSDDGGDGPDPGDDRQPPRGPIGGIPLPDSEQAAARLRGPHNPRRWVPPRRPSREPERRPVRLWPLRPRPFPGHRPA